MLSINLDFSPNFTTKTHTDTKTGGAQQGGLTKIKRLIMSRLILFLACLYMKEETRNLLSVNFVQRVSERSLFSLCGHGE